MNSETIEMKECGHKTYYIDFDSSTGEYTVSADEKILLRTTNESSAMDLFANYTWMFYCKYSQSYVNNFRGKPLECKGCCDESVCDTILKGKYKQIGRSIKLMNEWTLYEESDHFLII